jgi:small subunit ribosomal protein S16
MVKLRLTRQGAKKRPFYRIVAIDSREPTSGRPLEFLGTYDPCPEAERVHLESERIEAWIARGAQPSPTVRSLMRRVKSGKAVEPPKPKPHVGRKARAAEPAATEAPAAEAAPALEAPAAEAAPAPEAPAAETAPAPESQGG